MAVIKYRDTNGQFQTIQVDALSGITTINNLNDVDTATVVPQIGDLLYWDGTNWVPIMIGLDWLSDVDASTPPVGAALVWDGNAWRPQTGFSKVFYQSSQPTTGKTGDLWVQP